ncbi:MAG: RICIN domain-containing protein [Chitinophagales bacterium]
MKNLNLFLLVGLIFFSTGNLFSQVTHTPWQIHKGGGAIDFDVRTNKNAYDRMGHGDPRAYELKNIPAKDDAGWQAAPMRDGKVFFTETSTIPCQEKIDFTYFQTIIDVPSNVNVSELTISYDRADDGARIYFFNSKSPNGHFNPDADLRYNHPNDLRNINLANQVAVGENRVVIVQFDDCATGNNVSGINIKVNGAEIKTPPKEKSTTNLDGKVFFIQSNASNAGGRVIDAGDQNAGRVGSRVYLWDLHRGTQQQWKFIASDKGPDVYQMVSLYQNTGAVKYLDADFAEMVNDGGKIQLWSDNGGVGNQQWKVSINPNGTYRFAVYHPNAGGRVLDANPDTQMNNGGKIHLWHAMNGNKNQEWKLLPLAPAIKILSANYGLEKTHEIAKILQEMVDKGETNINIRNHIIIYPYKLADPAPGRQKKLNITYSVDGKEFTKTVTEGGTLTF